jgi:hypothetical protein
MEFIDPELTVTRDCGTRGRAEMKAFFEEGYSIRGVFMALRCRMKSPPSLLASFNLPASLDPAIAAEGVVVVGYRKIELFFAVFPTVAAVVVAPTEL